MTLLSLLRRSKVLPFQRFSKCRGISDRSDLNPKKEHIHHCIDMCRTKDYNNYLSCIFLPENYRDANFALRAFNIEISSIPESVNYNKNTARLRYDWWKQAIHDMYLGTPRDHPVLKSLSFYVSKYKLTRRWFERLIEAREYEFENNGDFEKIEDIENYSELTTSSIFYLGLETAGIREVSADHCASHLGKAAGIITLLKSVPFHLSQSRVYLPGDLMIKSGISGAEVIEGIAPEDKIHEVCYEMACVAHSHLQHARELESNMNIKAKPLMLPALWIDNNLLALEKAEFNVFDAQLQQQRRGYDVLSLLARMRWSAWKNTF